MLSEGSPLIILFNKKQFKGLALKAYHSVVFCQGSGNLNWWNFSDFLKKTLFLPIIALIVLFEVEFLGF